MLFFFLIYLRRKGAGQIVVPVVLFLLFLSTFGTSELPIADYNAYQSAKQSWKYHVFTIAQLSFH